jgi:deazaflavin-dependent oxidoreductase (nitroreductase family)
MTLMDDAAESPIRWVRDHVRRYEESGGTEATDWEGAPCLLLTYRGRRSGVLRRTALICGQDGADFVVVASKGGYSVNPLWYESIAVNPDVTVRFRTEVFPARAETVEPGERAGLWPMMTKIWPAYDDYQGKTDRLIPLVRLRRATKGA